MKSIHKYLDIVFDKHDKDWDTVIAICGKVGVGKSHLGLHMLDYWQTKLNGECKKEDIKHMCMTKKDFVTDLADCKIKEMTVYDEAGEIASRSALSKFNKDLMVAYQIIRADRLFTVLILPDIWYLDSYFRNSRIKALFYVTKRGSVFSWFGPNLKKLLEINQFKMVKNYFVTKYQLRDKYPIYKGVLYREYETMKKKKTSDARKKLKETKEDKINKITQGDIAEYLGVSQQTVSRLRDNYSVKSISKM